MGRGPRRPAVPRPATRAGHGGGQDAPAGARRARRGRAADRPRARRSPTCLCTPGSARMVVDGARAGHGWEACVLAAVLEERDVLRGRPRRGAGRCRRAAAAPSPTAATRHPRADRGAVRRAARPAAERARRAGSTVPAEAGPSTRRRAGRSLALAYPDRIAQARGGGRFRLRGGSGAWVPPPTRWPARPHLAVAELDAAPGRADARIRIAAPLDEADVLAAVGDEVEEVTHLRWDPERDDLRARTERRVGALLLSAVDVRPRPGPRSSRRCSTACGPTASTACPGPPPPAASRQRATFARAVGRDADGEVAGPRRCRPAGRARRVAGAVPRRGPRPGRPGPGGPPRRAARPPRPPVAGAASTPSPRRR